MTVSEAQAQAFTQLRDHYAQALGRTRGAAACALRPSRTPPRPGPSGAKSLVGNTPTADTVVWSVLSLIALLGGTGAWSGFGMQGCEYLDLGKFWQVRLTLGMFL